MTTPQPPAPRGEQSAPSSTARQSPPRSRREAHQRHATLWDSQQASAQLPEFLLPDLAPRAIIRDSLYDVLPLGALELDLLSTPEFVRLQGIKQLGFVYRVWPGATHTRFEHSLGVYSLMLRALRLLLTHPAERALLASDPEAVHALLAAALLHDIGHYPFSHAIEELGYPILAHEQVGRTIIEHGSVRDVLERHGISPGRVADLVDPPRGRPLPRLDALLVKLLSGPLDVDKLDYLPRDARACNVPYGGVDVTRLLGSVRLLETAAGPRLGVSDKGISPLNSLLHARQEMFDNVYWHHTNRAMMAMLLRAVQEAVAADAIAPHELAAFDDAALFAYLNREQMPRATRTLVTALALRQPYKVLIEVSARAGKLFSQLDALFWDQAKRRRVETQLAEALSAVLPLDVEPWDVLIDIPKPEKWEMDVLVQFDTPPIGMAQQMTWTEATGQRPSDLGIYEQHQRRIRIVAQEAVRDLAREHVEALVLPLLERLPTL